MFFFSFDAAMLKPVSVSCKKIRLVSVRMLEKIYVKWRAFSGNEINGGVQRRLELVERGGVG